MDGMELRQDALLQPQQNAVISRRQIMAVRILQMPSQELHAAISQEFESNPALEGDERESCHLCGAALDAPGAPCPVCGGMAASDQLRDERYDEANPSAGASAAGDDDPTDPMLRIVAGEGRGNGLLHLLRASLDAEDAPIAEYLVGSLDHHGYLPATILDDACEALQCHPDAAQRVLDALQSLEPAGIGARGAQECLLIQLRRLREAGAPRPLAEELVQHHLYELAFRHFREVGRAIGETPKTVEQEWQFIRDRLHPYPTHGFDPDFGDLAAPTSTIRPDVVIRLRGGRLEAEVVERHRYELRVNRDYYWARKHLAELGCTDSERQHIRSYIEQAQTFISALRQRWETMQRVSNALIELQRDFLIHGQSALKPLTRADVAERLTLHESTVSRATDGKFALLPNGRTISFDDFFDASLRARAALRELIAAEDKSRPLSDEQLAYRLAQRGFTVARRTVAKYRDEEQILPSRLRRNTSRTPRATPRERGCATASDTAAAVDTRQRVPALAAGSHHGVWRTESDERSIVPAVAAYAESLATVAGGA
jgi:RNA polymerase sigma-54 factor